MGIETFVIDLIEGKKKSFFLIGVLHLFSQMYRCASFFKNVCYDKGFCTQKKPPLPLVSIGNIVAGGTGKTPFIQKLVSELSQNPGEVAIVTRGYRSLAESQNILASSGSGPLVSPDLCGDEPYWLSLTTKASIWVGKHRLKSLKQASLSGARMAFLEDGFQHRKIEREIDIVLLNGEDPWGKGYFLPRGYLRESPYGLSRAHFIVVTQLKPEMNKEKILQEIRRFSHAPILGLASSYELKSEIKGKKIGAFCGIAKPLSFYKVLQDQKVEIVKTLTLRDHLSPSSKELSDFAFECKRLGAEFLLCTEKDRVKLSNESSLILPIEVLKMKFEPVWNENVWKEIVDSIQTRM